MVRGQGLTQGTRLLGAAFVAVAVALHFLTLGVPTIFLSAGLVAAFALWTAGRWRPDRAAVGKLYAAGVAVQALHFVEEARGGFAQQFPALFDATWDESTFVAFNTVWLVVFAAAAVGVFLDRPLAYLIVLFFALVGGVLNGVAHLGLCLALGRYFPGAYTAPLSFVVGVLLLRRLFRPAVASRGG